MKNQESIRTIIEAIIDKQIERNHPPETAQAYNRLIGTGMFNHDEARTLISGTLKVELLRLMRFAEPFNEERFILNLSKLPDLPNME